MEQNSTTSPYNFTVIGIFRSFTLCILTFLIVACNSLVLVALPRVNTINKQTKLFMRSLAIADIGTGVFVVFPKIASLFIGFWPYGHVSCALYYFAKIFMYYAEQFSFIGISVDRFIAVTKPLRYCTKLTVNRCRVMVSSFWILPALIVLYSVINRYQNDLFRESFSSYTSEEGACVLTSGPETANTVGYIIGIVVLTIGPVLAVSGMSLKILQITVMHIRKVEQAPTPQVAQNANRNLYQSRQEIKVTLTMLVTTGAYVVAWLPLMFNSVANFFTDDKYVSTVLWTTVDILFFSNCFWNAIIYSFKLSAFRRVVKQLLRFKPDNQQETTNPREQYELTELSRARPTSITACTFATVAASSSNFLRTSEGNETAGSSE